MESTQERVAQWNTIVGKQPPAVGTHDYWTALKEQADLIQEELTELYEAIKEKDITEVVDAGCDLDVVVSGLNYLSGSNYGGAITAVLDNNDLKWTTNRDNAYATAEAYEDRGVDCWVSEYLSDGGDYFYAIRRASDGKVMKPFKHPKVDLTPFVPEPVEESLLVVDDLELRAEQIEEVLEILPNAQVVTLENMSGAEFMEDAIAESGYVVLTVKNGDLTHLQTLGDDT